MGIGINESGYNALFRALGENPARGTALILARRVALIMYAAIGLVLVTALAIGAGIFSGTRLAGTVESNVIKRIESSPPALAADAAMAGALVLKKLAPIVTNLAAPDNTWVRLEAAVLIDRKSAINAEPMDCTRQGRSARSSY